jgi:hypothetical protein
MRRKSVMRVDLPPVAVVVLGLVVVVMMRTVVKMQKCLLWKASNGMQARLQV